MKISNSKKQLAKILHENGGWRDGEFAAQDKASARIDFYHEKPWINGGQSNWNGGYIIKHKMYAAEVIPNWHQTILSREEYFHLYPAPDADGWIEWGSGEKPHIDDYEIVDTRHRAGHIERGNRACDLWWDHRDTGNDIIAYRLHKPWLADSAPETKPTIEQLAADYRNAKGHAERKQQDADDAKADADEKLRVLELAGEAHGLLVSPITEKQEPGLVITNRSQLELGDVIWLSDSTVKENNELTPSGEYTVVKVGVIGVESDGQTIYPDFSTREWRFIRRP